MIRFICKACGRSGSLTLACDRCGTLCYIEPVNR